MHLRHTHGNWAPRNSLYLGYCLPIRAFFCRISYATIKKLDMNHIAFFGIAFIYRDIDAAGGNIGYHLITIYARSTYWFNPYALPYTCHSCIPYSIWIESLFSVRLERIIEIGRAHV